jgi:hypothetical protein
VAASCVRYYLGAGRAQFNPLLHLILPIGGIVLFFFPLYYQFSKVPPTYPVKYANWVALAWTILGVLLTLFIVLTRPHKLDDMERVYVEDETVQTEAPPAVEPA